MPTTAINALPSPDGNAPNFPPTHFDALNAVLDRKIVASFASVTARNTAITAPTENMVCSVAGFVQVYRAGSWRGVAAQTYSTTTVDTTQYTSSHAVMSIAIPDPGYPYKIVGQASLGIQVAPAVTVALRVRINGTDMPGVGDDFTNNGGASVLTGIRTSLCASGSITGASTVEALVWKSGGAGGFFASTAIPLYTQLTAIVSPA